MRSAETAALALLATCATIQRPESMIAIDCHAHVFLHSLSMPDPRRASGIRCDTRKSGYVCDDAWHDRPAQFLDLDNNYLLNVLRTHPDRLRDIAVVDQAARLAGRSASDRARIDAG